MKQIFWLKCSIFILWDWLISTHPSAETEVLAESDFKPNSRLIRTFGKLYTSNAGGLISHDTTIKWCSKTSDQRNIQSQNLITYDYSNIVVKYDAQDNGLLCERLWRNSEKIFYRNDVKSEHEIKKKEEDAPM